MHVVITGATGFIGSHVLRRVSEGGHRVTELARSLRTTPIKNVETIRCDLSDYAAVQKSLPQHCDALIHLAGRVEVGRSPGDPATHLKETPTLLLNLLETLRARNAHPLVLLASTDRQYALHEGETVTEDASTFPVEPYTGAKMIAEILLRSYAHVCDFPYIILRMDSVYGPGQPQNMFMSDIIRKCLTADHITVGALNVEKNFVFVADVAEAFLCALHAPAQAHNAVYNIGADHASLRDVLDKILTVIHKQRGRTITVTTDATVAFRGKFEVRPFRLSVEKAHRSLNWKPQTSLDQGIALTVQSFLSPL